MPRRCSRGFSPTLSSAELVETKQVSTARRTTRQRWPDSSVGRFLAWRKQPSHREDEGDEEELNGRGHGSDGRERGVVERDPDRAHSERKDEPKGRPADAVARPAGGHDSPGLARVQDQRCPETGEKRERA